MLGSILPARIHLLRVVADPEPDHMLAESIAAAYGVGAPLATQQAHRARSLELLRQNAQRYLEPHAMSLHDAGLQVTVDVRCGPPADVIVEAALEQRVALIALGAR
jgi:nucleotide-binding universal stress UspA family protein